MYQVDTVSGVFRTKKDLLVEISDGYKLLTVCDKSSILDV